MEKILSSNICQFNISANIELCKIMWIFKAYKGSVYNQVDSIKFLIV